MKNLKSIKYVTLILMLFIGGCSNEIQHPSSNLPKRKLLPESGDCWWDVSLPKDFDAKTTKGVWLVIRDGHGGIIGHSAVFQTPDMNESVRVVIQSKSESGRITAEVSDVNGMGATLPIATPTELDLVETRNSGTRVHMGDTLIKWKIEDSSEERICNATPLGTIQEGEAGLSLEEYQHTD